MTNLSDHISWQIWIDPGTNFGCPKFNVDKLYDARQLLRITSLLKFPKLHGLREEIVLRGFYKTLGIQNALMTSNSWRDSLHLDVASPYWLYLARHSLQIFPMREIKLWRRKPVHAEGLQVTCPWIWSFLEIILQLLNKVPDLKRLKPSLVLICNLPWH